MKKTYIQPSTELIRLDDCQLLAASTPEYDGPFGVRTMEELDEISMEDALTF